jgi:hypothetical protein
MNGSRQYTLFAFDCGATNWRLYRVEYKQTDTGAQILGDPQPASLTSFIDRKLPAVICLNPEGSELESFSETAQQQLEDEHNRERVREYFKPCIGSHLVTKPLPHQKRFTHTQALSFTGMLLNSVLGQLRQEKWRGEAFDERVWFTFAYPVHWRTDHNGKIFNDFKQTVEGCFEKGFKQIRFVAEPEGAILSLSRRGLLGNQEDDKITLIVDVGGSTTDIVAGEVDPKNGHLHFLGRYGEPFGGGLYDAELAKEIADELGVSASAFTDDPSALVTLRVFGQRLKESLSRQMMHSGGKGQTPQRTITLVMRNGTIYRRVIALDEDRFNALTQNLHAGFEKLMDNALRSMALNEQLIGQVVLVGGGAQLFTIINYLRQRFGSQKVTLADNSEEIVVQGIGLEYGASFEKAAPAIPVSPEQPEPKLSSSALQKKKESGWELHYGENDRFPLPIGVTKIGRGETNEICIDDLKASRFHLELLTSEDKVEVKDLESTNGTFVNNEKLKPNQSLDLNNNDVIMIGKTKFICKKII